MSAATRRQRAERLRSRGDERRSRPASWREWTETLRMAAWGAMWLVLPWDQPYVCPWEARMDRTRRRGALRADRRTHRLWNLYRERAPLISRDVNYGDLTPRQARRLRKIEKQIDRLEVLRARNSSIYKQWRITR